MTKILVVEDDQDLAQMVRSYLLFERYEVENVYDGQEGLSRVKTYEYDIIILDLGLPDCSGIEVLKSLREKGSRTPVLILTGKHSVEEKRAGARCRCRRLRHQTVPHERARRQAASTLAQAAAYHRLKHSQGR
jgi:Response regulators consisting of a CheY-like receiver domain and a winged-helix DNA-binding domain